MIPITENVYSEDYNTGQDNTFLQLLPDDSLIFTKENELWACQHGKELRMIADRYVNNGVESRLPFSIHSNKLVDTEETIKIVKDVQTGIYRIKESNIDILDSSLKVSDLNIKVHGELISAELSDFWIGLEDYEVDKDALGSIHINEDVSYGDVKWGTSEEDALSNLGFSLDEYGNLSQKLSEDDAPQIKNCDCKFTYHPATNEGQAPRWFIHYEDFSDSDESRQCLATWKKYLTELFGEPKSYSYFYDDKSGGEKLQWSDVKEVEGYAYIVELEAGFHERPPLSSISVWCEPVYTY